MINLGQIQSISIFKPDTGYSENIQKYTKKDVIAAIFLYIAVLCVYALAGAANTYKWLPNYFLFIFDLSVLILSILFLKLSKRSISTIGFRGGSVGKSIILGVIASIILVSINIIGSLLDGGKMLGAHRLILLFFNFLLVGLSEEAVFRGFIQTRMDSVIHNRYISILVVSIMFAAAHLPARAFIYGSGFGTFLKGNVIWIINLIVTHILLNFIYEKTNSIYGSVLLHWLSDLSGRMIF